MLTLSRGIVPCWMNEQDAASIGVADNDWVELYNDNGVMVTRAAVSARVPSGHVHLYHAPERTILSPSLLFEGTGGRGPQQPHPRAAQPGAAGRRLRSVHLLLQLLGPHRLQPGHVGYIRKLRELGAADRYGN